MNKSSPITWLACILTFLWAGCGHENETGTFPRGGTSGSALRTIRSTADLRRFLIPALATNEIVRGIGAPSWKEDLGEGRQVWHYSLPAFPADDAMPGSYVVGISVDVTNGCLAYWGCTYTGSMNNNIAAKQIVLTGGKGKSAGPEIQFFLVRRDSMGDGRFIDTERFPKLGFIGRTPIMTIHKLKEVTLNERVLSDGQGHTNWSFGIFLTQEDSARLRVMTATNISSKLLIMIGQEPVSAPTIRAPLETASLLIECQDWSVMKAVKDQLDVMERQK